MMYGIYLNASTIRWIKLQTYGQMTSKVHTTICLQQNVGECTEVHYKFECNDLLTKHTLWGTQGGKYVTVVVVVIPIKAMEAVWLFVTALESYKKKNTSSDF